MTIAEGILPNTSYEARAMLIAERDMIWTASVVAVVLATIVLPSDWLVAASSGVKSLSGTWQDLVADATGRASHFRITGASERVKASFPKPAKPAKPMRLAIRCICAGGNIYRASVAGTSGAASPPTGTGGSIADGGVTWAWVQAGTDMTIDNANLNAGQQVNVTGFTLTMGGA